jgi:uncharacterized protein (TIGR02001 family)
VRLLAAFAVALSWPASAVAAELSGEAGVVSDYRYRGVSLSDGRAAVQASATLERSGYYATAWASTLGRRLADSEIDLTAGYERELAPWISVDLSATRYLYPSSPGEGYSEAAAAVSLNHGRASASLGFSYAPRQRALRDTAGRRGGNAYVSVEAAYDVPGAPLSLIAGGGYERGPFDEVERGGKWDWKIGGEIARGPARLALSYVGSNADGADRRALVGEVRFSW